MFNNKNKQYIIFKEDIHQWKIKDNIYSYKLRSFFKKKKAYLYYIKVILPILNLTQL